MYDSLSSTQSLDKTLSYEIQFPPVASMSGVSDKREFDMTLSKTDVMKTQHVCVCSADEEGVGNNKNGQNSCNVAGTTC